MNQILKTKNFKKDKKKIIKFKVQLYISFFLIVIFSIYWVYIYNNTDKGEVSDSLLSYFNIERIYFENQNYTAVTQNEHIDFFVIGVIEIPKINIKYPILSKVNDELLKISACRFYGPYPNKIGNMCIAAHNYNDNRFFGNLYKLDTGDVINIYDSNNSVVYYYVYDKFEVLESNTSPISQNTDNRREITLVTCNNFNKNRLIIKARE